jgi:phosphoglycerate dehydrogenase-like enzyme
MSSPPSFSTRPLRPRAFVNLPDETVSLAFDATAIARVKQLVQLPANGPFATVDLSVLREHAAETRILITGWGSAPISRELLAGFKKLELLVHVGGSLRYTFPEMDFPENLTICSAAHENARPVAEHTLGVILAALRGVLQASRCSRPQVPSVYPQVATDGFAGRTVAIVGFGLIARHLIQILRPFGFRVLVVSEFVSEADEERFGIRRTDLHTAAREADVLSLHESNLPSFHRMVDESVLRAMREHAVLINTARGELIDEDALLRVLRERELFAVLDVLENEPAPPDFPLGKLSNCLITPHVAGSRGAEVKRFGTYLVRELENHQAGGPYENALPHETLSSRA